MFFFKNKVVWIGLGIIMLAAGIFTFAFMGSTVNPAPKELPLAIVVEDEGAKLPNEELLNISQTLVEEIQKRDDASVDWQVLPTKAEAVEAMNDKELYAAIILPEDLSQNVFSLLTKSPAEPSAAILVNEGMNQAGANVAAQISNGMLAGLNQQIEQQLFTQLEERKMPLSVDTAKLLSSPVAIQIEKINPVAANNANGNTPALFTQLLWITTFISSMILFTALRKSTQGNWTFKSFLGQLLAGILYVAFISSVVLVLAVHVLEIGISSESSLFFMMFFIGLCFFFLQSACLNWIGYPAAPLFILLLFFSMPILTMAPEMLPNITRDYLYSWVPFRFSVESFKDILFFGKETFENGIGTIGVIGLVSLLLMGLSVLKPGKKSKENLKDRNQTATNF
ncbi:hypothetical protein RRU94_05355 [Domibacillus sp. DTU_2020_1001157_1_SI_ALB_TIR_016]|uniref:YhgE/Pip domain-containing protein n=1 Tax=Domibacillus sp. DTU_2020_1001157_1_SI_ALB_TIR_016 TaxID=3077789 RepID=UPI0028EA0E6A|nr:ABC transporter permease [Domibacillus sp. DTU_2020_1001157_1_SI_ALB_TIR_016]WNS77906.1 hypothetical protein RRU94_05355 [Domibacillus sp. DTU_2020_1001157_1_SI_ALB_TIR_016]